MANKNKWIQNTSPDQPVSEFARQVISLRLKSVWHYLQLAALESDDDVEYVHQLRVATRRADSSISIFKKLLPKNVTRSIRKQLRRARQAAGNARDLDVLFQRLQEGREKYPDIVIRRVIKQAKLRRGSAQKPLLKIHSKLKQDRFKRKIKAIVRSIKWRDKAPEPTIGQIAQSSLGQFVDEFFAAAASDLTDISALHKMRIRGKKLRYAMELLTGVFGPSMRSELYPTFAEVQDKLGRINDHDTARRLFEKWDQSSRRGNQLARLREMECLKLKEECNSFQRYWTRERAAELEKLFESLLVLPFQFVTETASPDSNGDRTSHGIQQSDPPSEVAPV